MVSTNWRARVDDLTILIKGNPWPWLFGSDDEVVLDFAAQLEEGESLTNPAATLLRLHTQQETLDVDANAKLNVVGPQVIGTRVKIRMSALERGYYYRLEVLHGVAGNRRGANTIIHCFE